MHKLLATLLLVSTVPWCAHSQTIPSHRLPGLRHKDYKVTAHHNGSNAIHRYAAKTTATSSRLISMVSFEHDGTSFVPVDSASAVYSGTKGGTYNSKWDYWEWAFDNVQVHPYLPATSAYGSPEFRNTQAFDAANHITTSAGEEWIPWLSAWRNGYKDTYTYDAAGNRLTEISQRWDTAAGAWENMDKEIYTYTATNKVATNISESWNTGTGAWYQTYRLTYTYDAGDKPLTELREAWSSSASVWHNDIKITYTYDAANNLAMELYGMWNTSTMVWDSIGRQKHTYDASNRRTETLQESYSSSGVWEPGSKKLYSNFAGSQPQTISKQTWDGGLMAFENTERENYTYNADGFVTYFYIEEWNYATSVWELSAGSYAERSRYETYATGISDNTTPGYTLTLYPVPAAHTLTIESTWTKAEPFTVTITDMSGRVYSQFSHAAQKNYKESISTTDMQPGNYLVTLQSNTGKTVRTLTIVR